MLRWAILQHYEVCATPLLDVTHSLRVAASFAQARMPESESFLFVLALPQISGSITTSSEHGIQMVRLLSVCPPAALRPHFQEGYLLGQYPTLSADGGAEYDRSELDFSRRLLAKFRLGPSRHFWSTHFRPVPQAALFPDKRDRLKTLTDRIREGLSEDTA